MSPSLRIVICFLATLAIAPISRAADLTVEQTLTPSPPSLGMAGYDVVFRVTTSNLGPESATGVTVTDTLPTGVSLIWFSPACSTAAGTLTCSLGSLAVGQASEALVVLRSPAAGSFSNTVSASADQPDANPANNSDTTSVTVGPSPPAAVVPRYRLYSTQTLEHLFTTDLAEYLRLGTYPGWFQEGVSGNVLNAPGSYNGIEAVPYYRLYDSTNQWHHWTTDPNEYYTLVQRPNWTGEGVDGFILPAPTAQTVELHRLVYLGIAGLHHWTVDPHEVGVLTTPHRDWAEEPAGTGFLIR